LMRVTNVVPGAVFALMTVVPLPVTLRSAATDTAS
jgi:hypothetical protein